MRKFQKTDNGMFEPCLNKIQKTGCERKPITDIPSFVRNPPFVANEKGIVFDNELCERFSITYDELSRKVLFIGDSGEGKTNAFYQLFEKVADISNHTNINIIFDSKGDFKRKFADSSTDTVIIDSFVFNGNSQSNGLQIWNLFEELIADKNNLEQAAREFAKLLVGNRIKESGRQKFFIDASVEMLAAAMLVLLQDYYVKGIYPTNKTLVQFLRMSPEAILKRAEEYGFDKRIENYIVPKGKGAYNGKTLGVMAEVNNIISDLFIGSFGENGSFSIRQAIRDNKSMNIFIEYDVQYGETLKPIYTALISLAVKEVMGRNNGSRVNLFIDEFGLLDFIPDMESAVSFGREQGLFIAIGFQHIGQIRNKYEKDCADGMLNNFRNLIIFKTTDFETRDFIKNRYGTVNKPVRQYLSLSDKYFSNVRETKITDEDILSLNRGEALVSTADNKNVFKFRFRQVKE